MSRLVSWPNALAVGLASSVSCVQAASHGHPQPLRAPSALPALPAVPVLMPAVELPEPVAVPADNKTLPPQRLSQALIALGLSDLRFPAGLMWQRASAIGKQSDERKALLLILSESLPANASARADREGLIAWLSTQPITGREPIPEGDPRYLNIHPELDPVLGAGDQIKWTEIPGKVAVVGGSGAPCAVHYLPDLPVRAYLQACLPGIELNRILLVAPTGTVREVSVADWGNGEEPTILPGSYLWIPIPGLLEADQQALAGQLGMLGPFLGSPDPVPTAANADAADKVVSTTREPDLLARPLTALTPSSSDWGNVGLLQTPTARMRPVGSVSATISHVQPYTRLSIMLQPFEWLEGGFRYTDIANRPYIIGDTTGQSFKDKSIDLKLRLHQETATTPEVALGLRDLAGTGLFSGEYFVASKRYQQFDFSLGMGWGYLGERGDINNPLRLISDEYRYRPMATPGGSNRTDYFRGPMSPFGGVEWFSQQAPYSLKLEYDGNDYKNEPLGNHFDSKIPFNVGATYRPYNGIELQAGIERGDTVSLGLTLYDNLSLQGVAKLDDAKPVVIKAERPAADHVTDWAVVAQRIEKQVGAHVYDVRTQEGLVTVDISSPNAVYQRPQIEQIGRILHDEVPADVDWFTVAYKNGGLKTQDVTISRRALSAKATAWQPVDERESMLTAETPATVTDRSTTVYSKTPERFSYNLGLDYDQIIGGPNAFLVFGVDALAKASYTFDTHNWLSGSASLRLFDNYNKLGSDGPSGLPRVRTEIREYLTDSDVNMRDFQYNHSVQLGDDQFALFYAGYLERMFAGFGAEWLYRPFGSTVAFGLDINQVQQRDFAQDFGLQSYRVTTGHMSLYVDTGFEDILATFKVGQYLAGDRGGTIDLSRVFRNGAVMGAYATLTDASAAAYGEGRFTKGIYVQIPFDALLTSSNRNYATANWTPLTRDGGAILNRAYTLYGLTDMRSPRTLGFTPAEKSNANTPTP